MFNWPNQIIAFAEDNHLWENIPSGVEALSYTDELPTDGRYLVINPNAINLLQDGRALAWLQRGGKVAAFTEGINILQALTLEDIWPHNIPAFSEEEEAFFATKKILVTGAAGSIGRHISKQLAALGNNVLGLLDNAESPLVELHTQLKEQYPEAFFQPLLCDIRDPEFLGRLMEVFQPDIVIHTAAYKHVPFLEGFQYQAYQTNVIGTENLATYCSKYNSQLLFLSTDKAVNPSNIMGQTKAQAEELVLNWPNLNGSVIRFGNLLGSTGSVVPYFERLAKEGRTLPVTDTDVSRYFISIPKAARLILKSLTITQPKQTYLLEMGSPVLVLQMARWIWRLQQPEKPFQLEITGLRKGEKLHEQLHPEDIAPVATIVNDLWQL